MTVPNLEQLKAWIGREDAAGDVVTARLVGALRATLDLDPPGTAGTPLGLHWCLAPITARQSALGTDGHPATGGFLPPVPLPARMWAGGGLMLHDRLQLGDVIERRSRVSDIRLREGRTGLLYFVTVEHVITTPRGTAITERQDIVYRNPGPAAAAGTADEAPFTWTQAVVADPVLLFRYSALTFNGHRIHYDRDYAMNEEGYRGLVVHGPLQATLLLNFAETIRGTGPSHFEFRAVAPLFDGQEIHMRAAECPEGLALWMVDAGGMRTMTATARW